MRLRAAALILALAATLTYGQTPAAEAPPQEALQAEVIHVTTLTGDAFDRLVNLLSVFKASIRSDTQLRTIVVYAPKDVVAQMRRVVAELDTPGSDAAIGRNIEMTLTLLRCSQKPSSDTKLPADLEPVAKQLRAATQYKDIQLWDTIPLRLQEGKDTTETMQLPGSTGTANQAPTTVSLWFTTEAATRKGDKWSVRFRRASMDFRIPIITGTFKDGSGPQYSYQNVGLNTAGDFLEGQKTVLGKISGADSDTTIFAVISLKVLP
ncbi:MAG TPA: hypothetical protein VN519_05100 [Bryobacteraceae bacterium]|nr:hypothetical protein [Bryobacteraceae bacterium]